MYCSTRKVGADPLWREHLIVEYCNHLIVNHVCSTYFLFVILRFLFLRLGATSCGETHENLERVVDHPLQASESSDHDLSGKS